MTMKLATNKNEKTGLAKKRGRGRGGARVIVNIKTCLPARKNDILKTINLASS
jgi:hypothetical protein